LRLAPPPRSSALERSRDLKGETWKCDVKRRGLGGAKPGNFEEMQVSLEI